MLLQIYRICIEISPQMKITDSSKLTYWLLCNCSVYFMGGFQNATHRAFSGWSWGKCINLLLFIFSLSFGNHCFCTGLRMEAMVLIQSSWLTAILMFLFVFHTDVHTEAVQAALAKYKERKMPMPSKRRSVLVHSSVETYTPPGTCWVNTEELWLSHPSKCPKPGWKGQPGIAEGIPALSC